jgi:N-acetylglucosaminyldiphosphoundecaprenol N-acetyl-beta-D-mannosaminyltransferase
MTDTPSVPAYRVCGVRIDAHQLASAVESLLARKGSGEGIAVHLVNAGTLALARKDRGLRASLNRADVNFPDGMPLIWIGRRLGLKHLTGRVYGPDLMLETVDRGRSVGLRHYLYGSSPEVIERLVANLTRRFPGVDIVGAESPPYRALTEAESEALVERVRESAADVVWVGLGTPKQDRFVDDYRDRLNAALVAVGAAFDFHAGVKRQAPAWIQRSGFVWLHRLLCEPRRLWRRYLVGNTQFLWGVLRDRPRLD